MRPQIRNLSFLLLFLQLFHNVLADASIADASSELDISRRDADARVNTRLDGSRADSRVGGSTKPDVGTKDAPVDGMDGKPHAGPWVDATLDTDKKKDSGKGASTKEKVVPEDSVMNDPNRPSPKKGTTGTEGGVSEKTKEQKAKEDETGRQKFKKPESPKDAASIPHNEESEITDKKKSSDKTEKTSTDGLGSEKVDTSKEKSKDKDKGNDSPGLEKPDDLPKKPHDLPPPVPPGQSKDSTLGPGITEVPTAYTETDEEEEGKHDFIPWDSLAGSFSSIAATEIGDKTFIVAALMAMRHPRLQVFTAAYSALFIMTILSGVTGHAVGAIMSKRWAALVAALLFLVFGVKSLREGAAMNPDQGVSEEIREVQAELEEKEFDISRQTNGYGSSLSPYSLEAGRSSHTNIRSPSPSPTRSPSPSNFKSAGITGFRNLLSLVLSPAWVETFSMTFVGELGDRSQIATVAMAAGQEYFWVMVGASLGHAVCTAGAVIGGSVLAGRITMRKVTLIGGGIFIGFGLFTLIEAIQYWR